MWFHFRLDTWATEVGDRSTSEKARAAAWDSGESTELLKRCTDEGEIKKLRRWCMHILNIDSPESPMSNFRFVYVWNVLFIEFSLDLQVGSINSVPSYLLRLTSHLSSFSEITKINLNQILFAFPPPAKGMERNIYFLTSSMMFIRQIANFHFPFFPRFLLLAQKLSSTSTPVRYEQGRVECRPVLLHVMFQLIWIKFQFVYSLLSRSSPLKALAARCSGFVAELSKGTGGWKIFHSYKNLPAPPEFFCSNFLPHFVFMLKRKDVRRWKSVSMFLRLFLGDVEVLRRTNAAANKKKAFDFIDGKGKNRNVKESCNLINKTHSVKKRPKSIFFLLIWALGVPW